MIAKSMARSGVKERGVTERGATASGARPLRGERSLPSVFDGSGEEAARLTGGLGQAQFGAQARGEPVGR